jgi:ribosomal protein S6
MHKNNFCTIPSKASKYKDSITISQSTIYKNNDEGLKHNKNIKKLKKSFYNNDFKCKQSNTLECNSGFLFNKNYILSKKILAKYNSPKLSNLGLFIINNIIQNKKCIYAQYIMILLFSVMEKLNILKNITNIVNR